MSTSKFNRRDFLNVSAGAFAATALNPYHFTANAAEKLGPTSKNDRLRIGTIGMRYQGTVVAKEATTYGDVVAICDVDRQIAEKARQEFDSKAELYEDYRKMLERDDLDVITIGTPDHWHAAMLIDACRAGKDVYCEKPLTLTLDEGKTICKVVEETGAIVQVGSWQRSDHNFRLATEMVRHGRIGRLKKVTVVLGKNDTGGPFSVIPPPDHLNWDIWQGQTPDSPYMRERCHANFRWWQEYSGGQMTDWGAHHLDIARWAIGEEGPVEIEGEASYPEIENGFNVAIDFTARFRFANGVTLEVLDHGRNGIMFEGTEGRVFVNRGTISGRPVEELKDHPLERDAFALYDFDNLDRPPRSGKLDAIKNHMGNFYDCLRERRRPISDVWSQHRSVSVCHLGNIAMRLVRKLRWDAEAEQFQGDTEADALLARPRREGFELSI